MASRKIRWLKSQKQKVIDEYLADTGSEVLRPAELLAYIRERPDHILHGMLFSESEAERAEKYSIKLLADWCSGLRTTVVIDIKPEPEEKTVDLKIEIKESPEAFEVPGLLSPRADRVHGGGYLVFDPSNASYRREFAGQAASALAGWLRRYGGVQKLSGVDLAPIEAVFDALREKEREGLEPEKIAAE